MNRLTLFYRGKLIVLACALTCMTLSGCGMNGPLYLPDRTHSTTKVDDTKTTDNIGSDDVRSH